MTLTERSLRRAWWIAGTVLLGGAGVSVALKLHALANDGAVPEGFLPDLGWAARFVAAGAILAMCGAVVAGAILVPAAAEALDERTVWGSETEEAALSIGLSAALLLLVSVAARFAAQLADFYDPADPLTTERVRALVTTTTWGRGWTVQAAAAVVAVLAWLLARRGAASALVFGVPAALFAIVADTLTGHAMAGRWAGAPGVALHAAHLLGAGVWIGTLGVLTVVVRDERGPTALTADRLRACFSRFAPWAMAGGGMVVCAGLAMGLEYAGGLDVLVDSLYGVVLVLKSVLAGAVLLLGAWHWRRAVPRLADPASASIFGLTAAAELALAWLVVAASAGLVALPAPGV